MYDLQLLSSIHCCISYVVVEVRQGVDSVDSADFQRVSNFSGSSYIAGSDISRVVKRLLY